MSAGADDWLPPLPDDDLVLPPTPIDLVAYDTETPLFSAGRMSPPIIVASVSDGQDTRLLDAQDAITHGFALLETAHEHGLTIVGTNTAYDLLCLADARPDLQHVIFRALRAGHVHDISITEAMHAIRGGWLGKMPNGQDLRNADGKPTNRYSLYTCVGINLGRWDAKAQDAWRKSYAVLARFPITRWPPEARAYPLDDVKNPLAVAEAQLGRGFRYQHEFNDLKCVHCGITIGYAEPPPCTVPRPRRPHDNLFNLAFQVESDYCLKLGCAWGLRTDPDKVAALAADVEKKSVVATARFQKIGWIRADGTEDQSAVKKAVATAYGAHAPCPRCRGTGKVERFEDVPCRGEKVKGRFRGCTYLMSRALGHAVHLVEPCVTCNNAGQVRRLKSVVTCKTDEEARGCDGSGFDLTGIPLLRLTETGGICTDRDAKMESGDENLADYGNDEWQKAKTTYLPYLRTGIDRPLSISVNVVVESTRPSYEGTPLLQMPRKGLERECVRARGAWCGSPVEYVFGSSDYKAGELCALAQATYMLFGYSRMREAINASGDPGILHADLAAQVLGISLDEFLKRLKVKDQQAKDFRQASKPYHFGRPAGMGAPKIVLTNRKKSAGFTVGERGPSRDDEGRPGWNGIRFCALIGGAKECGIHKITTWKKNECTPVCAECVKIVDGVLGPAYMRSYPEIKDFHKWGAYRVDNNLPAQSILWDADANAPRVILERGGCGFSDLLNHCVDYETEALTRRGWLRGDQITLKDQLLTKNIDTGVLEWQHPTAVNHYPDYNGKLVQFESKTFSAVSTPNHRWMVSDQRNRVACVTTDSMYKNGMHKIHRTGQVMAPDNTEYSDDVLELIGWFLTDGCIVTKKGSTAVSIYQTKPDNVVRIDKLFDRLDIGAKKYGPRGDGSCVWNICDNPIRRVKAEPKSPTGRRGPRGNTIKEYRAAGIGVDFDEVVARRLQVSVVCVRNLRKDHGIAPPPGHRPDGKGVAAMLRRTFPNRILTSEFIHSLSKRQAESVVSVMLLGDGTTSLEGQSSFYTKTEVGADAFQSLLVVAGKASRSRYVDMSKYSATRKLSKKMKNIPKMTGVWVVAVYKRTQSQVVQSQVSDVPARGVWCPTVPNGFFVARRKKTVYITGNSFQSMLALIGKHAHMRVVRECYTGVTEDDTPSDLAGSRVPLFLYDECFSELIADKAHLAGPRIAEIMMASGRLLAPHVTWSVDTALAYYWNKSMEEKHDATGKLIPWEPPSK